MLNADETIPTLTILTYVNLTKNIPKYGHLNPQNLIYTCIQVSTIRVIPVTPLVRKCVCVCARVEGDKA
jgi:hypothetical protein